MEPELEFFTVVMKKPVEDAMKDNQDVQEEDLPRNVRGKEEREGS